MLYLKYKGGDRMEIIIHGSKIKITKAMNEYIEEKLGKLDKYLAKMFAQTSWLK